MKNGTTSLEPSPPVNLAVDLSTIEPGVPFRLSNVSWDEYEQILELIGDRYYRSSFIDGEFEILMPTSSTRAAWVAIIGRLIQALAFELDLPIKSLDPTTLRREDVEMGLEPDRSFYFDNEPLVSKRLNLDFNIDPPPDLVVEVEVTSSAEKRMRIFAALRVPEVWRYNEDDVLTVHQLAENGDYVVVERSRFFPQVPLSELVRFAHLYEQIGERELMKSFHQWVRQQIVAKWQAK